jgi:hypothetical protein
VEVEVEGEGAYTCKVQSAKCKVEVGL